MPKRDKARQVGNGRILLDSLGTLIIIRLRLLYAKWGEKLK